MTVDYKYETTPFSHQREHFEQHCSSAVHALFWEQGTGKTKPIIDTFAHMAENDKVDALLVVAPNGVHLNWITDELPVHLPKRLHNQVRAHAYKSPKAKTKWHQRECDMLIKHKGLAVLCISYDAFMTKEGKKFIWRFLQRRRCLYVLDESDAIKNPGAKRTKSILASGVYAPYRRIATGTPVPQGPFDIYSQVRFLDEGFWKRQGIPNYTAFKRRFGVWLTAAEVQEQWGYDPGYDKLIEYKNIDQLNQIISEISTRVLKEDVLDLPRKLFSKRYFEMNLVQQRAYEELKSEYILELEDGVVIDADMAIVRLLRLQQIACGYVQADTEEPTRLLGNSNPRLELLEDITAHLGHKAIIWSRFTRDIDQIMDLLGRRAVRYDGKISDEECARSKQEFQHGDAQFFVGNQQKGASGLTLHAAKTAIYYANNFNLRDRLQSEDRCHRIGQEGVVNEQGEDPCVNYIDLICPGTVEQHIVKALRSKYNIAAQITGDELREWI